MRQRITFECCGSQLEGTLDTAPGQSGLLIVSGGNEIRIGAHRGMARLAADIAAAGYPVLRFDRRGIGDSEGENGEFLSSGPDIAAAVAAFRTHCPGLTRIIAFGNCDAAAALLLHTPPVDGLVLANIWILEGQQDLPPPAAIKARYLEKLTDPRQWVRLFTGAIDLRKLAKGLSQIMASKTGTQAPSSLAARIAAGLEDFPGTVSILLANRDNTAIAFIEAFDSPAFSKARAKVDKTTIRFDSASHSFAPESDYALLKHTILTSLS